MTVVILNYLLPVQSVNSLQASGNCVCVCVSSFNIRDLHVAHKVCLYVLCSSQNKL